MGKGGIRRGLGLRLAKPTGEAPLVGTIAYLAHLHKDKPGPGAYDINKHYKIGGGRFGSGNPKTGFPRLFLGVLRACARTLTRSRQHAALDMLVYLGSSNPLVKGLMGSTRHVIGDWSDLEVRVQRMPYMLCVHTSESKSGRSCVQSEPSS